MKNPYLQVLSDYAEASTFVPSETNDPNKRNGI